MYARKQTHFSASSYFAFVKNRWRRIAPAFYTAAVVVAIGQAVMGKPFPWFDVLAHATFSHLLLLPYGTNGLASPFWSLATEWHFYLVLPFFIWAATRWSFWPALALGLLGSILFRIWLYASMPEIIGYWGGQIPTRFVEFAWGMGVAYFYAHDRVPPRVLQGARGFLIGFAIAYLGRLLMVAEIVRAAGSLGFICKAFAEPILTLGFALMLWNVLFTPSIFQKGLSHPAMQNVGRWSYSIYLWHWYPCLYISQVIVDRLGSTPQVQYLALGICLCLVIPFSYLSYTWLEMPYFTKRQSQLPVATSPF
jgi:peptidoglycan/LPS O-acetylase OafA/YrhL